MLKIIFDYKTLKNSRDRQFLMMEEQLRINQGMCTHCSVSCDVILTLMSAKKGTKLFDERAVAAMFKIFKQMDKGHVPGKPAFRLINYGNLIPKELKEVLEVMSLIK